MNLKRIWKAISLGLEHSARRETRRQLLAMDDRRLAAAGISRELLEQGVNAWPWRELPAEEHVRRCFDSVPAATAPPTEAELERAAAELRQYTDAELGDLGLARGGIADAVRHGRPGIDDMRRRAA